MKKCITALLLCLIMNCIEGQISSIKKNLKELFYEINFPTTKYDLRKMINSNENFSNFFEANPDNKYDIFHAAFSKNYKLSYISKAKDRQFDYWFYEGTDKNYCVGLVLKYSPENVEECSKQYNELAGFFKGFSFKTEQIPFLVEETKVGDLLYLYSSTKSYHDNNPYLIISMRYVEFETGKFYSTNVAYYINSLY